MNIPTTYAATVTVPLPDDDVVKPVIETYFGGTYQPDATLNVVKMFAGTGTHFAGVIDVVNAIFGPDGINPKHRQMCMMRVAKAINAPYEWQLHSAIGRNLGLTEDEIAAFASDGPVTGIELGLRSAWPGRRRACQREDADRQDAQRTPEHFR